MVSIGCHRPNHQRPGTRSPFLCATLSCRVFLVVCIICVFAYDWLIDDECPRWRPCPGCPLADVDLNVLVVELFGVLIGLRSCMFDLHLRNYYFVASMTFYDVSKGPVWTRVAWHAVRLVLSGGPCIPKILSANLDVSEHFKTFLARSHFFGGRSSPMGKPRSISTPHF